MSNLTKESAADAIIVIDALTRKYSAARQSLTARVKDYNDALEKVNREHSARIRETAARAAICKVDLRVAIENRPDLFVQPRTMTLHSITVGFKKGAGKVAWDDEAQVVEKIRAQFPKAKAEALLDTTTVPRKDALMGLEAAELAKLGCRIEGTGDAVVIKAPIGDLEKIVATILEKTEPTES